MQNQVKAVLLLSSLFAVVSANQVLELSDIVSPVVINTWVPNGFEDAARNAWVKLRAGGSALDAVEYGCNWCEELQPYSNYTCGCDGSVGLGGSPDQNGETTLDAMIMDGDTMNVGAVGAIRRVQHAISVARKVMEHTFHTLLVGDQATDFALSHGFKTMSLSTSRSAQLWADWFTNGQKPDYKKELSMLANEKHERLGHDTIGMVALDSKGSIACGTTTNGAIYKMPGRVGDSPIMGAGAYCESGVGGATQTGDGDQMMRFLPSFAAVNFMRAGDSPTAACEKAVEPIRKWYPSASGALICMNAKGEFGGAKLNYKSFSFSARNENMNDVQSTTI